MNGIIMDDITNHKAEPFLRSHYTDILALSKLFCIIESYSAIQKQIQEIWPSIKTCSRITNDMTLDKCLKAFDMNIEEAEAMNNEWETSTLERGGL
tara:strand:+ start:857 stop:1144 length:288 start_codon:yes stop_codon:yes gene_type:complete